MSIQITVLSVLYNGVTRVVVSKLLSQENKKLYMVTLHEYFIFSEFFSKNDLGKFYLRRLKIQHNRGLDESLDSYRR